MAPPIAGPLTRRETLLGATVLSMSLLAPGGHVEAAPRIRSDAPRPLPSDPERLDGEAVDRRFQADSSLTAAWAELP